MPMKNICDVITIVEEAGYHLLEYRNAKEVVVVSDEGYKYIKSLSNLAREKNLATTRNKTFLQHNIFALDNLKLYVERESDGAFHVISNEYINGKTPVECICDKHKDKGVQSITPDQIVNGSGSYFCKYCNREHSQDWKRINPVDIISHCKDRGSTVVDIATEGNQTVVYYVCDLHQSMGIQRSVWYHLKQYVHCCKYCAGRGLDTQMYQRLVSEVNPRVVILSEYNGYDNPIWALCSGCGHIWQTRAGQLMSKTRHRGCPQCARVRIITAESYTQADFEAQLEQRRPDLEPAGEYQGSHKPTSVRCKICGNLYSANACNILNSTATCPTCRTKWPTQQHVRDIIISWGIDLIPEYWFPDCVYKRPLLFDAYLPEYNILVEYDGEQHYQIVDFFHGATGDPESDFLVRKARDRIKDEYCSEHHIALIRIPYWEKNNLESFLLSEFAKLGITINTQARETDRAV